MKAIILAAGRGTRLDKYTGNLPKGMLTVFGKSIIQQQVETYRRNGITDITIVKGYCAEKIEISDTKTYINDLFAVTNMVESLFCAANELDGEIIISYADILFEDRVLKAVIECGNDFGVLVDLDWKEYWKARYGKVDFDTESLSFSDDGSIKQLGVSDPPLNEIDGRYVGMIRLSSNGTKIFSSLYFKARQLFSGKKWLNGRSFENIFMTDFLQELINQNNKVYPILINHGWLEFDTNEDYEIVIKMHENKSLQPLFIVK